MTTRLNSPLRLPFVILCLAVLTATAATEEEINKRFPVQAGGRLVVDVDLCTPTAAASAWKSSD